MSAALDVNSSPLTVADLLAAGGVRSVYQPIVTLEDRRTVAVEALARGPLGAMHLPGALFRAAAAEGLAPELEWACRAAALRGVLEAGLPDGLSLFVNVEPSQLDVAPPARLDRLEAAVQGRLTVVVELTERDLVRHPAEILRTVDRARRRGWGIALDDVGAHPASLALMPVLRPDVVKLDMALVQGPADVEVGRVASAVSAYAEESGAAVLAEGIETTLHLERAIALGATLGQGWLFARPAPLAELDLTSTGRLALLAEPTSDLGRSPFELVGRRLPTRTARKAQLLAMSHHLERQTADLPAPPLLLAAFEDASHFTPATVQRYARYARGSSLVAALGVGLGPQPAAGVRGAHVDAADPLAREWTVVVLSPHFAGALIARDLGDDGPDRERRFEFALTHRREHVTAAARCLMQRIAGQHAG